MSKKKNKKERKMIVKQKPLLSMDDPRTEHVKLTSAFIFRVNSRYRAFTWENRPRHLPVHAIISLTKLKFKPNSTLSEKIDQLNSCLARGVSLEQLQAVRPTGKAPKPQTIEEEIKPRRIRWELVKESKFG